MSATRETASDGFGRRLERPPRLSDAVAEAMLAQIIERGLKPGDPLPSERELCEQFEVSRTVIREAVKALGARGVVRSHTGRGLQVAAVGADDVSTSMRLYLHGRDEMPYSLIHEVREAIEIQIAGLAAVRATPEELAELRASLERTRSAADTEEHSRADVEFHRTLARLTHNDLFLIVLDSIGEVLLEIRRLSSVLPNDAANAYREHRQILRKVESGDPEGAREAMRRHLEKASRNWRRLGPVHLR